MAIRHNEYESVRGGKKVIAFVVAIVVIILAVVAGLKWYHMTQQPAAYIESNKYQAVYLTDNSVYFGKLTILGDGSMRLTNVYYPQKAPTDASDPNKKTETNQNQSSALVKFGSELLGGEDQIVFSKQQVAYWLNLKPDSKVTKAIEDYKK